MERYLPVKIRSLIASHVLLTVIAIAISSTSGVAAEDNSGTALKNRTIGYVMTERRWSIFMPSEGKADCPHGFNNGPREQFKILFPDDGKQRTVLETQLAREGEIWVPSNTKEPYPFYEAGGKISLGMNLDGRDDPEDFVSPEGERGVDNQLYRAIGCVNGYGDGVEAPVDQYDEQVMQMRPYNRTLIELTKVDSLTNDDDVTVTAYRGLDPLRTDASGKNFMPGSSQRIDMRWGKRFIQTFHGKITNGVLTSGAADLTLPDAIVSNAHPVLPIRDLRFRLKLTPEGAEGLMGGYADIEGWYLQLNTGWSTHHQSYGQVSSPSLHRALYRLADAYPDPKTGINTAISSAFNVKFKQAFILHPPEEVASKTGEPLRTLAEAE